MADTENHSQGAALMASDLPLMPQIFVDQAERSLIGFIAAYSDSMPVIIDQKRIIRYIDNRLRALLGFGWQSEIINGCTKIDILLPEEHHSFHNQAIDNWFKHDPVILDMHARGPLPLVTKQGKTHLALVKLVPLELEKQGLRPIFDDDENRFARFAAAFVTILPPAWSRYAQSKPQHADVGHGGGFSGTTPLGPGRAFGDVPQAQQARGEASGDPRQLPGPAKGNPTGPEQDSRLSQLYVERNWAHVRPT